MNCIKTTFLILISLFSPIIHAHTVFIVIHGTWSSNSNWYIPGGDFFNALEKNVQKNTSTVVPFHWSGSNNHFERVKAAEILAKLIQSYDAKTTTICIVAHSHGGNVATLASQILAQNPKNNNCIDIVYTLGTPICKDYSPHMNVINYLYNLFSFEDLIQPVLGAFKREHRPHERIANIRVFINGKEPNHTKLHDPCIAQWLPILHNYFIQFKQTTFNDKDISEPCIVYFDSTKAPHYELDTKRTDLIERDQRLSLQLINSLRSSFEIGSNIPLIKR